MRAVLIYVFITFLFFSPIHSFSQTRPVIQVFDSTKVCEGYILWMGNSKCTLMDRKGNTLFSCPGNLISFFNKKELIIAHTDANLVFYNKNLEVMSKFNLYIHHELTFDSDNNILLFSNETQPIDGIKIRFDNILCLDSSGKIIYKWSTFDQRGYLMSFMMKDKNIFLYKLNDTYNTDSVLLQIAPTLIKAGIQIDTTIREIFHMNAIQVIPENESEKKDTIFRKGNLLHCCPVKIQNYFRNYVSC